MTKNTITHSRGPGIDFLKANSSTSWDWASAFVLKITIVFGSARFIYRFCVRSCPSVGTGFRSCSGIRRLSLTSTTDRADFIIFSLKGLRLKVQGGFLGFYLNKRYLLCFISIQKKNYHEKIQKFFTNEIVP